MKKRHVIRVVMLLGGLCLTMWQLPDVVERVRGVSAASGLPFAGPMTRTPESAGGLLPPEAQALVRQLESGRPGAPEDEAEMIVLTPKGERLSPEERERLLREAERAKPKPGSVVRPSEKQDDQEE